jgi:hypothetical protein
MTFDNPSTPHPGQRFVIILKVSKNTKKNRFTRIIHSERLVRQPLDNLKSRGDLVTFEKALQK